MASLGARAHCGSYFLVAVAMGAALSAHAPPARADDRVVLYVDRDDDDADGIEDGAQNVVAPSPELFALPRPRKPGRDAGYEVHGDAEVRVLVDGHPFAAGKPLPGRAKRVELQATGAGRAEIDVFGRTLKIGAVALYAVDGEGREVSLATSHASLERTTPSRILEGTIVDPADTDALRFVVAGFEEDLPGTLPLFSVTATGAPLDALPALPLTRVPCPAWVLPRLACRSTLPVRAVADDIERDHPLTVERSIKAVVGGALTVGSARGSHAQMIRVAGPRRSPIGAIGRYRATLRVTLVRTTQHGVPPIGGTDAGALVLARAEIERANALWGACGIGFGPAAETEVRVVDPPPAHLLALGGDLGLPASGGALRFRVDGREVSVAIPPGASPSVAAHAVVKAVTVAGFGARASDNAPIVAGAFGSADVLVRRRGGALASLSPPDRGPLSSDATLTARIGHVDLEDGLQHFGDVDAIAGTVEERTLIKAFDAAPSNVIDVFMVQGFAGGGRIGESFIAADGGAVRNVLLEDRAGLRADRASFALAHELGHVLLDEPGHPDDYGTDTPTRLMDADAANGSVFGPRRLIVDECARAILQSGPAPGLGLLRPWPLVALGAEQARPARAKRSARR